jgi:uncharacterized protein (TIGR02611 family)
VAGEQRTRVGEDGPGPSEGSTERHPDRHGLPHVRFRRARRARAAIKQRRALDVTWRLVVLIVGLLIIAGGLGMLVLPGPGWAAIFVGLAVLATEFDWAQRLLHRVRDRVRAATRQAKDPKRRVLVIGLGVALLLLGVAAGVWYVNRFGWGLPSW